MGIRDRFSKMLDMDLVDAFKADLNPAYLAELCERHKSMAFAVAMKYLNDSEAAKDAVQEIYIELYQKLQTHLVKNFKAWYYTLVKNFCLQNIRKRKGVKDISFEDGNFDSEFVENPSFEHLTDEQQPVDQAVQEAVSKLKEPQRVCIELFFLQEKSYKEIAELTGYDLNEVKSHIQNGKRNLGNLLSGLQLE